MVIREKVDTNKKICYDTPKMSYVGNINSFFNDDELHSKEDLIEIREGIIKLLSNKEENEKLKKIQRELLIRKLTLIYLYLDYHEYFEKRYGKKSYRFIGRQMDVDLEDEKTIEKASDMDSLIDISHDGGFVDYWSFGNSILFRTIKKLRS
jgi:hypothetical protein